MKGIVTDDKRRDLYPVWGRRVSLTGPKLSIKNVVIGCAVICYLSLLGVLPYVLCIMAVLSVGILPMLVIYGSAIRNQFLSGILAYELCITAVLSEGILPLLIIYGSAIRHQSLSGVLPFYLVLSVRVAPARPAFCTLYYCCVIRWNIAHVGNLWQCYPSPVPLGLPWPTGHKAIHGQKKKTGKGPSK
jgi:hypothetical protein